MDILVKPCSLSGIVKVPESKSDLHRKLIAAFLAGHHGSLEYDKINACDDVKATVGVLDVLEHYGTGTPVLDCHESGSTLRFLIPVASALYDAVEFKGSDSLFRRPIAPLLDTMAKNGVNSESGTSLTLKLTGKLRSGEFILPGNISSQFVSGLLFALPLLSGNSVIKLTTRLESVPYVDMTLDVLRQFGIEVRRIKEKGLTRFYIPGSQRYICPSGLSVEGDWSAAACFIPFGVECIGLDDRSLQPDRKILEFIPKFLTGGKLDISDCPDLFPILSVLNCKSGGNVEFTGCDRLRFKESDRIESVSALVNSLVDNNLTGGEVWGYNDHRIVMAAAVASCFVKGDILIHGAEAVKKSYPQFWNDFKALGGRYVI